MIMKKLSLLLTIFGLFFLSSCEKGEITSLTGTTWRYYEKLDDAGWKECTLTFTSTHATYSYTNDANNNSGFTGTYTFNAPEVEIVSDHWTYWGDPPEGTFEISNHHRGTVRGKTMRIEISEGDEIAELELKRR